MRIMVTGSRVWADPWPIYSALVEFAPAATTVIHGGARGADKIACSIAEQLGMRVEEFKADWPTLGRPAGIIRNVEMLESRPDLVLAFARPGLWGSKGTKHAVDEARRRGIAVRLVEQT